MLEIKVADAIAPLAASRFVAPEISIHGWKEGVWPYRPVQEWSESA